MNIYLVSRTDRVDYDEYDAFVVLAQDEREALSIAKKLQHGTFEVKAVDLNDPIPHVILGSFNAG